MQNLIVERKLITVHYADVRPAIFLGGMCLTSSGHATYCQMSLSILLEKDISVIRARWTTTKARDSKGTAALGFRAIPFLEKL